MTKNGGVKKLYIKLKDEDREYLEALFSKGEVKAKTYITNLTIEPISIAY
jgi:hypothetical protein